jgi:hypothetical protein
MLSILAASGEAGMSGATVHRRADRATLRLSLAAEIAKTGAA